MLDKVLRRPSGFPAGPVASGRSALRLFCAIGRESSEQGRARRNGRAPPAAPTRSIPDQAEPAQGLSTLSHGRPLETSGRGPGRRQKTDRARGGAVMGGEGQAGVGAVPPPGRGGESGRERL